MQENNKRRAEDAARLPAEKLEWETPSQPSRFGSPEMQALIAANFAAPAVDAAELDKLKALAGRCIFGDSWYQADRLYYTHNDGEMHPALEQDRAFMEAASPAAILRIAALVVQQAARIAELEAALATSERFRMEDARSHVNEMIAFKEGK